MTSTNNLQIGMLVEINPQSDRTRKLRVQGKVLEILTKNKDHPHGILVRLETGETGRVKQLIEDADQSRTASNISITPTTIDTPITHSLETYISQGENHNIEFKSGVLWSSKLTNEDIKNFNPQSKDLHTYGQSTSKIIISKTIAGFLNTDGGILIIGIKENKNESSDEIIGIEHEYSHIKDQCQDGYRRMLVDLIKDYFPSFIFNHLNQYIKIEIEEINKKLICGISISKSEKKVFLNINKKDHFYIRTDASTRELQGEEIVDYCIKRFEN